MKSNSVKNKNLLRISMFLFSGFLIVISLTAFWLHRSFYNTEQFSRITTEALTSDSSRQAIGSYIVDTVFEDRSLIRNTVGPRISSLVSGILASDLASSAITELSSRIQLLVTTERRDPIVLDLSSLKTIIVQLQSVLGRTDEEREIKTENIPDEITIIDTQNIPNVNKYSIYLIWLGPGSFILASSLLGFWIYRGRKNYLLKRIRIVSLVVIASSATAAIIGPLYRPAFLSNASSVDTQVLLGNIYDSFMRPFYMLSLALALITLVVFASSYLYPLINSKNINIKNPKSKK